MGTLRQMPAPQPIRAALLLLGCWLVLSQFAYGMEHVTLSNGFSVDCHHRGTAPQEGKVRLFLNGDGSSYLDVDADRIQAIEPAADNEPKNGALAAHPAAPTAPHDLNSLIAEQGLTHRLNTDLLKSVVMAESGGHVRAVSRTGAKGLMQLMPATAKSLGVTDSFAPEQNLRGGTDYLDQLLVRYHDNLLLALAAYNAGPGAVDRYHGIPPFRETQAYVARIVREFNHRTMLAQRDLPAEIKPAP